MHKVMLGMGAEGPPKMPRPTDAHICEQVQSGWAYISLIPMYDCHFRPLSFGVVMQKYQLTHYSISPQIS